jgi:hypothetical protein
MMHLRGVNSDIAHLLPLASNTANLDGVVVDDADEVDNG